MLLEGKVVVVTGGSRGIGAGIALAAARQRRERRHRLLQRKRQRSRRRREGMKSLTPYSRTGRDAVSVEGDISPTHTTAEGLCRR